MTSKPHPWVKRSRELRERLNSENKSQVIAAAAVLRNFAVDHAERIEAVLEAAIEATQETEFWIAPSSGKPNVRLKTSLAPGHRKLHNALRALAEGVEDDG